MKKIEVEKYTTWRGDERVAVVGPRTSTMLLTLDEARELLEDLAKALDEESPE